MHVLVVRVDCDTKKTRRFRLSFRFSSNEVPEWHLQSTFRVLSPTQSYPAQLHEEHEVRRARSTFETFHRSNTICTPHRNCFPHQWDITTTRSQVRFVTDLCQAKRKKTDFSSEKQTTDGVIKFLPAGGRPSHNKIQRCTNKQ